MMFEPVWEIVRKWIIMAIVFVAFILTIIYLMFRE